MHDPRDTKPDDLSGYLERMSKVIFQSGMNWKVVEAKWAGTKEAFGGFDPQKVSRLTPAEIDQLAVDPRLIKNRKKIEAIADNAAMLLELDKRPGGFAGYLAALEGFEAQRAALSEHFRFLGETSAPMYLAMVGEPIPQSYIDDQVAKYQARGGGAPG
jgi:3-methyladenine DNA glycosylase Tag